MSRNHKKKELLAGLAGLAEQFRTTDAEFLKKVDACPSAKSACTLLNEALTASSRQGEQKLLPDAGWIHPLV